MDRATTWKFQHEEGRWRLLNEHVDFLNIWPWRTVHISDLVEGVYVIAMGEKALYVGETGQQGAIRVLDGLCGVESKAYPWRDDSDLQNKSIQCMFFDTWPESPRVRHPEDGKFRWERAEERQALEHDIAKRLAFHNNPPRKMQGAAPRYSIERGFGDGILLDRIMTVLRERGVFAPLH